MANAPVNHSLVTGLKPSSGPTCPSCIPPPTENAACPSAGALAGHARALARRSRPRARPPQSAAAESAGTAVDRATWERLRGKLDAAGVPYQVESGGSIYFRDPDGARLEPLADPLGEMYGARVI
ncbi:hypothetical protein Mro02_00390 [Microbispora rosea subsp. aerata]|nr:hypothetical protein Mro02_00390 [Microbispora rosea subsp. aerata]